MKAIISFFKRGKKPTPKFLHDQDIDQELWSKVLHETKTGR